MAINNTRVARKIEIAITMPDGTVTAFREDDIIRCVTSLRSDLSPIDPTLPESEFEADIYAPDIIGASIAELPDETAITYRTGNKTSEYWGTARYFYMDNVSWEKNVLHIHARDQVHKLDEEMPAIYIGQRWSGEANRADSMALRYLYMLFIDIIQGEATAGGLNGNIIEHLTYQIWPNQEGTASTGDQVNAIIPRGTRRETIAKLMNLCRFDFPASFLNNDYTNMYLTYVDAGYPKIRVVKPGTYNYTSIYEEDCGDIREDRPKNISKYTFKVLDVNASSSTGGWVKIPDASALAQKQQGLTMSYTDNIDYFMPAIRLRDYSQYYGGLYDLWSLTEADLYYYRARPYQSSFSFDYNALKQYRYGYWLLDGELTRNPWNFTKLDYIDLSGGKWTTGGDLSPASTWQDYIDAGAVSSSDTQVTEPLWGIYYALTNEQTITAKTNKSGAEVIIEDIIWNGEMYAINYTTPRERIRILPNMALDQIAKRPTETGSFVYRSLDSLQPRDVIRFNFIEKVLMNQDEDTLTTEDGTELMIGGYENRTVETITTTYENGGGISEVTYRRGII